MSKSDPDWRSRILITDSKEDIALKLRTAVTDSLDGVSYDREKRPGVSNILDIMYYMDESIAESQDALARDMQDMSMKALKERAAEVVDAGLRDVRGRYEEIMGRADVAEYLSESENVGCKRVKTMAGHTIVRVKKALGLGGLLPVSE